LNQEIHNISDSNSVIFPNIDIELIKALEQAYPNVLPSTPISEKELAELIGIQKLIQRLKDEYAIQNQIIE